MANGGLGGLIGGLLGVAILANVAGNIIGKSARTVGRGARAVKSKVPMPRPKSSYW